MYGNYQQPYQTQPMQQPTQQVQQTSGNTQFFPLTLVNTEDDIKAYIVAPNNMIFLYADKLNKLTIKRADNMGRYSYETFNLNKDTDQPKTNENYALKSDLARLEEEIKQLRDKLGEMSNE
jgi:hypothetical protein